MFALHAILLNENPYGIVWCAHVAEAVSQRSVLTAQRSNLSQRSGLIVYHPCP